MLEWFRGKQNTQPVPHPELVPLSEEECTQTFDRDPFLSLRDYSDEEIARARAQGRLPSDMREYCYHHGITWQIDLKCSCR
jgi:hypothetical protein